MRNSKRSKGFNWPVTGYMLTALQGKSSIQTQAFLLTKKKKTKKKSKLFYLIVIWEGISEFVAGCWNWWKQFTPYLVSAKNSSGGMWNNCFSWWRMYPTSSKCLALREYTSCTTSPPAPLSHQHLTAAAVSKGLKVMDNGPRADTLRTGQVCHSYQDTSGHLSPISFSHRSCSRELGWKVPSKGALPQLLTASNRPVLERN